MLFSPPLLNPLLPPHGGRQNRRSFWFGLLLFPTLPILSPSPMGQLASSPERAERLRYNESPTVSNARLRSDEVVSSGHTSERSESSSPHNSPSEIVEPHSRSWRSPMRSKKRQSRRIAKKLSAARDDHHPASSPLPNSVIPPTSVVKTEHDTVPGSPKTVRKGDAITPKTPRTPSSGKYDSERTAPGSPWSPMSQISSPLRAVRNVLSSPARGMLKASRSRSAKKRNQPTAGPVCELPDGTLEVAKTSQLDLDDGSSVTAFIVDEEAGIFVFDLLTSSQCDRLVDFAEEFNANQSSKSRQWRKLYTYTKMDLPMMDLGDVQGFEEVKEKLMARINSVIAAYFKCDGSLLKPRTWKEPHFLKYVFDAPSPHCGVEMHYDGCAITWNLMLSRSTDYDGGGTYIRRIMKTVKLQQGQVLVHPGELFHCGVEITRGTRYLAVCFTDGWDPEILDNSSAGPKHKKAEKNSVRFRTVGIEEGTGGKGKDTCEDTSYVTTT